MAKIIRREWTSVCVRAPTRCAVARETRTSETGRSYTDTLEMPRGSAARQGCSCTSTLATGPRTQTARHSWHSVFP
jgi:hypothetical protein